MTEQTDLVVKMAAAAAGTTSDVIISCLDSIRHISGEHIEGGSIVYLDAGCTESFQYLGAYSLLLELGASSVCSLENISPLDMVASSDPTRKVVVFTSRVLSDAHRYILRCLTTHQNISECIIFTAISEAAHSAHPDSPLGPDAFREYEILLVQDYEELSKQLNLNQTRNTNIKQNVTFENEGLSELIPAEEDFSPTVAISDISGSYKDDTVSHTDSLKQRLQVSVFHFPMILCPLSPRVFVLPSEGSVAEAYLSSFKNEDSISPQLPSLSTGSHLDGEDGPPGAILTAQVLYHLVAKMDLKMEIYSLGDLSKTVGKLLTDMSSLYDVGRRKRSAGLLLIDRTLDLLTPCSHGDSLADRIFSALPRRERTTSSLLTKGSQTQIKNDYSDLQHGAVDVQIPLESILRESNKKHHIIEKIEDFLHGWDSNGSAFKTGKPLDFEKYSQFETSILHGSFVSSESFRGTPYLEAILDRRAKDGALLVRKWLQEALRRDNINVNVKLRPGITTKSEFDLLVRALARNELSLIKNKGIIQLAAATSYALDEKYVSKWDAFISAEKMLHVSAGETTQSLAAQITDLINKSALVGLNGNKNEPSLGLLSFQDVLLLTAFGYILAGEAFPTSGSRGPFSWQEEHFMKEAIVDVIMENPRIAKLKVFHDLMEELYANFDKKKSEEIKKENTSPVENDDFDDEQWGSWGEDDAAEDTNKEQAYGDMQLKLQLRDRVDNLFKFFHKLSSLKKNIPLKGELGVESNFLDDPYSSKGMIYKLLTRILEKHDIPGLEYHSSTVGRIFKSGFGRFGLGQAKPNLADQNVILVFVIGGINGVEVREAQEALSECGRPDIELIIGGTTLLTPDNMYNLLLGDSSYSRV